MIVYITINVIKLNIYMQKIETVADQLFLLQVVIYLICCIFSLSSCQCSCSFFYKLTYTPNITLDTNCEVVKKYALREIVGVVGEIFAALHKIYVAVDEIPARLHEIKLLIS